MLNQRGPLSVAELCKLVAMDKSTASRNLQRMRRRGWLATSQDNSGISQRVALAPDGARVLQAAFPMWRRAQEEARRRLGAEGLKALEVVAAKIVE